MKNLHRCFNVGRTRTKRHRGVERLEDRERTQRQDFEKVYQRPKVNLQTVIWPQYLLSFLFTLQMSKELSHGLHILKNAA